MRIEIKETKRRLTKENSALTSQMEKCEQQIDTTTRAIEQSNGLQGEAYDAIRERITMRPLILKTHHIVYEEMRNANEQNIAALEALPRTSDGVLDTDECERRINRAQERIAQLQTKLDSYIYKLRSNPTPASVLNNPVFNYDKEAYIRSLTYNFEGLMEIMRQIIYKEQDNIRQAEQYDQRSAQIYSRMESLIAKYLDPATLSIETCLKTGSYEGTTGWTEGIDAEYNKSRKVRDVETSKLLSDEDLAEYRNAIFASKDGNIDAKSIYDDTGWFNEKLYGILCFLHQNDESLVNGQDIDGISQAYLYMSGGFFNAKGEWVEPNTEAIEQFLNASYFATGEKFTKYGSWDDTSQVGVQFEKFAPFSLLSKVYEHSVNVFDGMDKPTEGCENYQNLLRQYYGSLAGLKLLQSVSSLDTIDVAVTNTFLHGPRGEGAMENSTANSPITSPHFKIATLDIPWEGNDKSAFAYLITNNSHAQNEISAILRDNPKYEQFASIVITGNRDSVFSGIWHLIEAEHLDNNFISSEDIIFKAALDYAIDEMIGAVPVVGSYGGATKALIGLKGDLIEAEMSNAEHQQHYNASDYIRRQEHPGYDSPIWEDWAYAYSGTSASTVSDNSISGFPTGEAKKWYDVAYQKYIELGSPEGSTDKDFEKWCGKSHDLARNSDNPKERDKENYDFIKDDLIPAQKF